MNALVKISDFLNWGEPHCHRNPDVLPFLPQIADKDWWDYIFGNDGQIDKAGKPSMDCNGLAEYFLNLNLPGDHNTRSRFNYSNWCAGHNGTDMRKAPMLPGQAVFHFDKSLGYIDHVGFLLCKFGTGFYDWLVMQAESTKLDVRITKLHVGDGAFNRWGLMMKYFVYDLTADWKPAGFLGTSIAPATPVTPPTAVPAQELSLKAPFMEGPNVKLLQTLLKSHGCDPGDIDGVFGPQTLAAVRKFQSVAHLVVDGVVGPKTWASLIA